MLEKLEELGELENTLVIVTSDNGMPFPRIKGQVYEYSNHLPLAVMWPAGIKKPGRVIDDFISFIDFAPTFLELAQTTDQDAGMQPITGKSLTGYFNTEQEGVVFPERNYVLVGKERHDVGRPNDVGYPVRGIFKGAYLYLRNFEPGRWPKGNPETGYLNCDGSPTKTYILDTRRKKGIMEFWQLNFGKRTEEELYNIIEDPMCMNNLARETNFSDLKTELELEMNRKLTEEGDPRLMGNGAIFENYPYVGAVKNYYNRYISGEEIPAGWVNKTDYDAYLKE
jgi:arylsulfatase A-like enzyme